MHVPRRCGDRPDIDCPAIAQAFHKETELMPGITHGEGIAPLQLQCTINKGCKVFGIEFIPVDIQLFGDRRVGMDQVGAMQRRGFHPVITERRKFQVGVG